MPFLHIRRTRVAPVAPFAWGLLVYNLFVVLWGAVVRASVSGDGCGQHWPLCEGQFVPTIHRTATVIEYAHRLSSGLVVPLVLYLVVWVFRVFPKGHAARRGAAMTLIFTLTEGALGAGLVLLKLVAHNNSISRAVGMSLHLVNTFLLLMSLALTAWWSSGGRPFSFRRQGPVGLALGVGLLAALFLAVSGSVTALVDTLYPAQSLLAALRQDISPGVHYLIRLRLLHPIIAISVGLYSLFVAGYAGRLRPSYDTRQFARYVVMLFVIEIGAGFLNVLLLAPIWMQLVHLLVADLLWINLVLLTASALAKRVAPGDVL